MPSSFKERAQSACRRILEAKAIDQSPANRETVATSLQIFAQERLLDFRFLDPAETAICPEDIHNAAAAITVLASRSGALASIYMINAILVGASVSLSGTLEQKRRFLPALQRGEVQMAFALTESAAGSDAAAIATTASRRDNGAFLLNGEKLFATGAATADYLLVVTGAGSFEETRAFSLFVVPVPLPGITIEPLPKLAANVHASCRIRFDAVELPAEALLGGPEALGKAWRTVRATGSLERLIVAALATGLAGAIVDRAITFAQSRRQFDHPIASFQAIQHAIVDMRTIETAMQMFVERAIAALSGPLDPSMDICMAKYFCAEQLQRIVATGMRILGGRSYFEFEEMSRYYRESPFVLYAGGTIEIQKMLIARAMGLPVS